MLTRPITRPLTRPITRPMVRQSSVFDPLTLFAQGQQGAWYDPSDLTTLFTDSDGSDPVSADSEPTGMALDKRLGLELGPELVANGDFSGGLDEWGQSGTGSAQVVEGTVIIKGTLSIYQSFQTAVGRTYRISFSKGEDGILRVGASINGTENISHIFSAPEGFSQVFVAVAEETFVTLRNEGVFGPVSVRELPGNHAVQNTTSMKPTYRTDGTLHWLEFDGDDDALVANIPGITNATVAIAKSTGTEITYPVDLSSGTFTMNETNYGVIIREGEFTEQEALEVTTYLNAKAGIS